VTADAPSPAGSIASGSSLGEPASADPPRLLSAVMLGVAGGAILVPLNSTMLAVALPAVMDEFGLSAVQVTSLVTLYLGVVAIALPVGGALGDRYGARRVFLAGVLGFGAASLLAALSGIFVLLEAARILQAASGALLSTSAAALIREVAPPARRGETFGFFDLLIATSAAAGPFVGGVLVSTLGWRSMFVLAAPIALGSALVVGVVLGRRGGHGAPPEAGAASRLDVAGLVLLGLTITAFLVALRGAGADAPGPVPVAAALAVVPLFLVFIAVELRQDRPAVDPRLFRRPAFAAAVLGVFGATIVLHGAFILVPLLVERLLDETATTSGIVLLGIAGVSAVVAPFGGRASDRHGRRILAVIGSLVTAGGLAGLWLLAGAATAVLVAVLLGVVGLGMGLAGSPRHTAALESIDRSRVGMAAGAYYTGRYLGGVVGASVAGAVLGSVVTTGGVALGFAILTAVSLGVAAVSFWLPSRNAPHA
jgi:EmrB/QacA subfamily drug resistance transporter